MTAHVVIILVANVEHSVTSRVTGGERGPHGALGCEGVDDPVGTRHCRGPELTAPDRLRQDRGRWRCRGRWSWLGRGARPDSTVATIERAAAVDRVVVYVDAVRTIITIVVGVAICKKMFEDRSQEHKNLTQEIEQEAKAGTVRRGL